jgi:hypothetical protein
VDKVGNCRNFPRNKFGIGGRTVRWYRKTASFSFTTTKTIKQHVLLFLFPCRTRKQEQQNNLNVKYVLWFFISKFRHVVNVIFFLVAIERRLNVRRRSIAHKKGRNTICGCPRLK